MRLCTGSQQRWRQKLGEGDLYYPTAPQPMGFGPKWIKQILFSMAWLVICTGSSKTTQKNNLTILQKSTKKYSISLKYSLKNNNLGSLCKCCGLMKAWRQKLLLQIFLHLTSQTLSCNDIYPSDIHWLVFSMYANL